VILPDHWECHDFHGLHPVYRPGREFCDLDSGGEESEGTSLVPRELNPVTTNPEVAGEIFVQGRSYPAEPAVDGTMPIPAPDQGPARVHLVIRGKDVQVNREFEEALAPPTIPARAPLQRTWRNLGLSGRVNFDAEVIDIPGHPKDIDVGVSLRGCSMKAKFFPYYLSEVGATVHYAHDQVDVSDVQARHGNTQLAFRKAQVLLRGEEGFQLRIGDPKRRDQPLPALSPSLEVHDLVIDSAFLAALPLALRKGLAELKMEGAVDVNTVLVIDQKDSTKPPQIWWEGGVALPGNTLVAGVAVKDAHGTVTSCGLFDGQQLEGLVGILVLDRANVLGQPVSSLRTELEVAPESPQILRFRNLSAGFFGGSVGGEARVELSPKLNYELNLMGLGIQLEQFGQNNVGASADLQGQAMVGLYLNGSGTEVVDLKGNGEVDVPNGKLYRLPVLLDILKTIGLRPPDRTAFEQAHMKFAIENGKLHVQSLDLLGNAVSLRGQGTVNLDGSHVNLDFNADWGALQMFPSVVSVIPQTISDQLLKIKVRGKIGDVHFEKELVPGLVDPIKRAFGGTKVY
jgi:AsmA-like C-terminal region